jgi:hypothetical protein
MTARWENSLDTAKLLILAGERDAIKAFRPWPVKIDE